MTRGKETYLAAQAIRTGDEQVIDLLPTIAADDPDAIANHHPNRIG